MEMTGDQANALAGVAIQLLPEIIQMIKDRHAANSPDAPVPTDEEVNAAYTAAYASSVAKDEAWLAAHPQV